jgi:hypothetical protein
MRSLSIAGGADRVDHRTDVRQGPGRNVFRYTCSCGYESAYFVSRPAAEYDAADHVCSMARAEGS